MKKEQKEFLIELYNSYPSTICTSKRKLIKELFPELFENKLEVGKWYVVHDGYGRKAIIFKDTDETCYGVNYGGHWSFTFALETSIKQGRKITPATGKEVKEALIKEAKKRGLVEGVLVKDVSDGAIEKMSGNGVGYYFEAGYLWYEGKRHFILFKEGKWAEPLQRELTKELTKEQIEKELGYKIKIVQQ